MNDQRQPGQAIQPNQVDVDQARLQAALNAAKLPDSIKSIPEYSGDKISLLRWITHVDAVLADLTAMNIPILQSWQLTVRSKITGEADRALVASGCDYQWPNIKLKLVEHFGDKRNLQTIMAGMRITMGGKMLGDYYLEATKLSADIGQNVALEEAYVGHTQQVMHFANKLVLSAFIDGLNQDMKSFVMARGPTTLAEAKSMADEFQNSLQREKFYDKKNNNEYFKQGQSRQKRFQKYQNPQTPQNFQNQQGSSHFQNQIQPVRPIVQQNLPQVPRTNNNQQNYVRALEPDHSMRSRRSNVPMSGISYRSNAINNNEAEENYVHSDEQEENNEEFLEDEINFQLSLGSEENT